MLAPERSPVLPELKTAHEQGLDNAEAYTWNAVFLPKGTPSEIVGRLNAALVKVMNNPAFQQKLARSGSRWSRRRDAARNISAGSSRARSTNGRARSRRAGRWASSSVPRGQRTARSRIRGADETLRRHQDRIRGSERPGVLHLVTACPKLRQHIGRLAAFGLEIVG